jgi:hypothetical protein
LIIFIHILRWFKLEIFSKRHALSNWSWTFDLWRVIKVTHVLFLSTTTELQLIIVTTTYVIKMHLNWIWLTHAIAKGFWCGFKHVCYLSLHKHIFTHNKVSHKYSKFSLVSRIKSNNTSETLSKQVRRDFFRWLVHVCRAKIYKFPFLKNDTNLLS